MFIAHAHPGTAAAVRGCLLCVPLFLTQLAAAEETAPSPPPAPAPASSTNAPSTAAANASAADTNQSQVATVLVTARRLNAERSEIETQTGASTYKIDSAAVAAMPGGENQPLNQVLLQAPDVVQDSFGQIHVRGDHNDLQYRLNGVILPEGISVFSQTLSPRLISSLSLITGALPAEYGLRTAGIVDLTTTSGVLAPGGYLSLYGGSYGRFQPSAEYGGAVGSFSYYVNMNYVRDNLGIENPANNTDPLHDRTNQVQGFSYLEDILDPQNRVSLILGLSDQAFQIPNQVGLQPSLGLNVNGVTDFLSDDLNENQHELAEYAVLSWQHSAGAFNFQSSLSARFTSLHFAPDWTGDLLYNGIAQDAFKGDTAFGWQTDSSYKVSDAHTVRAGFYFQHDESSTTTTTQALCQGVDVPGLCLASTPVTLPLTALDTGNQVQQLESVYLQDEWLVFKPLTVNYGLRFDHYSAYSSGGQVSPRVNFVWQLQEGTTIHGGYSKYFTPPPFELISAAAYTRLYGTSALPVGSVTADAPPVAESANYYDLGIQQKLLGNTLTLGVDGFYEQASHLIDEGQFGAPIILTPFNYRYGNIGGVEFTANYSMGNLSTYGNLSFQSAKGKDVESSQFNFSAADFAYIQDHYIHLDHEGRVAASGGVAYLLHGTRLSTDFVFGTGLRTDLTLPDGSDIPNGDHTPSYLTINLGASHDFKIDDRGPLQVRFDVINLTDKEYQIRSGTGIGVFAPQWGARRSFYAGLAKYF
jgi:outer membrane receptor for ferrienterochelin and colicins